MYRIWPALFLTLLLTTAQALVWFALHRPVDIDAVLRDKTPQPTSTRATAESSAPLAGLAFSAYGRWQSPPQSPASPLSGSGRTRNQLADDLRAISRLTQHIRTYSAQEWPDLPALTAEQGIKLTLGIWLTADHHHNQREIDTAIALANRYSHIQAVIVGNETQLQSRVALPELVRALETVRAAVPQPVSTAEPWHVWLDTPELADHVDFITVHLLPYWEGIPVEQAVDSVFARYRQVQQRFADKRVIIGETGWPSDGPARGAAMADRVSQAVFVRQFLQRLPELSQAQPAYFLMEAIDQPWKVSIEGEAGAHWGLLDADRQPKTSLSGPVARDPHWLHKTGLACTLGALACLLVLGNLGHLRWRARLLVAVILQGLAAIATGLLTQPLDGYLTPAALVIWALMLLPSTLMLLVLVAQTLEFADLFFPGQLRHSAPLKPWAARRAEPIVSLHLATCNEPANMVIANIQHLMALDWPALEIIIIDNNTRHANCWQPVRDYLLDLGCVPVRQSVEQPGNSAKPTRTDPQDVHLQLQRAGLRLVYRRIAHLDGYKAGALNRALELTHPTAEWIGVIDADYAVRPDWLQKVGGWLDDTQVDVIQSPQAHVASNPHAFTRIMQSEYDGFFRIGMHHRHERNAIIQHGTMALIRAETLRKLDGWDIGCICEDTELGLRILQTGSRAVYIDHVMGAGQLPADLRSYCSQRYRWACGAMQILKTHARALLGGKRLTTAQRYHFIAGWLPWWGDLVHALLTLAAVVWSVLLLAAPTVNPPSPLFMLPPLTLLTFRMCLGPLLYRRRVSRHTADWLGCAVAGLALSHTIARGIVAGLVRQHTPFVVTRKTGTVRPARPDRLTHHLRHHWQETGLLLTLTALAGLLLVQGPAQPEQHGALQAWIVMLLVQALPYAATCTTAVLSWLAVSSKRP